MQLGNKVYFSFILFFTNLPPLLKTRSKNILFLQNQLLISSYNLKEFSFKNRLRIRIERFLLKNMISNIDSIYVQSSEMQNLCKKKFTKPCYLMPFFAFNFPLSVDLDKFEKKYDFIYSTIALQHICSHTIRTQIFKDLNKLLKEGGSCCF